MPTILILLFTILVMVTVIPYAFSSVFRQMEAFNAMEAAGNRIPAMTMTTVATRGLVEKSRNG